MTPIQTRYRAIRHTLDLHTLDPDPAHAHAVLAGPLQATGAALCPVRHRTAARAGLIHVAALALPRIAVVAAVAATVAVEVALSSLLPDVVAMADANHTLPALLPVTIVERRIAARAAAHAAHIAMPHAHPPAPVHHRDNSSSSPVAVLPATPARHHETSAAIAPQSAGDHHHLLEAIVVIAPPSVADHRAREAVQMARALALARTILARLPAPVRRHQRRVVMAMTAA